MFIIHRIVYVFNVIAILALLGAYLAPYITPELSWHIAFLGLAYPVILILNMLFILYWGIFLKLRFMFSLAAIIIGSSYIPRFIQFGARKAPQSQADCIQVLSYNSKYFGIHDNIQSKDIDRFFEKLDKVEPDVLCLQELFTYTPLPKAPVVLQFERKYKNYHKANIRMLDGGHWLTFNIGILCRYPIVEKGVVEHDSTSGNYTIYADMVKGKDTIRIITTHLQSIAFEKAQYQVVAKNLNGEMDSVKLSTYKAMAVKMKRAFLMRSIQADKIAEFISQSPHKVILCGDFNDSPTSYAYRTIRGDFKDAFMEAGTGLGKTYVGPMPSLRIDYILGDPSFEFYNYYTKAFDFSDHKMISCTVKLK